MLITNGQSPPGGGGTGVPSEILGTVPTVGPIIHFNKGQVIQLCTNGMIEWGTTFYALDIRRYYNITFKYASTGLGNITIPYDVDLLIFPSSGTGKRPWYVGLVDFDNLGDKFPGKQIFTDYGFSSSVINDNNKIQGICTATTLYILSEDYQVFGYIGYNSFDSSNQYTGGFVSSMGGTYKITGKNHVWISF